jgi:menaquinone-9 beta-reductase
MIQTEVLIVGGGPAGAACAGRLRELGMDCLILDRQAFPRSKPCAGWVTPQVFKLLNAAPEEYSFGLTHFNSFQVAIKGVSFRLPTHQYAIRRVEFDAWLLERTAVNTYQHNVKKIRQASSGFILDDQFQAKVLVGAGGTHCPVRRLLLPSGVKEKGLILAKEEEFPYHCTDDRCRLWFFEDGLPGYAWYVPKSGGFLNIGIGGSAAGLKQKNKTLTDYWENHLQRLQTMDLVSDHLFKPKGYSYYFRQKDLLAQNGNIFLVGDALGLATRDMGEGIGPAIQSGILAAEAIKNQTPYKITAIPRLSFPSLLGWRQKG